MLRVQFKLSGKQHSAVCYGRRQLVTLTPLMEERTDQALFDRSNPDDPKARLLIDCDEDVAVALAHCAREFAYDGHSPGPMSMLSDAENAMWRIQEALETAGSEHFEECMNCGGNPTKEGCEVCGVVGYF
jgi:hypothetical protein